MLISIVIPVYNVEEYLETCVESVMKLQTSFEAILVDDGSTDSSGILCDNLAARDNRIRVIHQKNGGLSAARNTGIQNATGDYVLFLDSDDFLDPIETDKMLENVDETLDILVGLYREYYTDTKEFRKESCESILSLSGKTAIDEFLRAIPADGHEFFMIACRFLVKLEHLKKNNLFFLHGILHEDEEWTSRLLCSASSIFVTHFFFYQYRQARLGAITYKVKAKNIWDRFTIIAKIRELSETQEPGSAKKEYLNNRMADLYLGNMLYSRILTKEEWNTANAQFREHAACAAYMCGRVGRVVKLFNKLIGTKLTCKLLKLAYMLHGVKD